MSGRNLLAGQVVHEMKITISTVDNNTMKHGNAPNNLPAVNAYVVTRGLTKQKKNFLSLFPKNWRVFEIRFIFNPNIHC